MQDTQTNQNWSTLCVCVCASAFVSKIHNHQIVLIRSRSAKTVQNLQRTAPNKASLNIGHGNYPFWHTSCWFRHVQTNGCTLLSRLLSSRCYFFSISFLVPTIHTPHTSHCGYSNFSCWLVQVCVSSACVCVRVCACVCVCNVATGHSKASCTNQMFTYLLTVSGCQVVNSLNLNFFRSRC